MAAARLHNSSNTLKRQQAESAGRSAEVDAHAASLSARQAELDGLSRELTKDRSLLEQLAGQLEVRGGSGVGGSGLGLVAVLHGVFCCLVERVCKSRQARVCALPLCLRRMHKQACRAIEGSADPMGSTPATVIVHPLIAA